MSKRSLLALTLLTVGFPKLGDTCTFLFSGTPDDTLEGARPILRAGVQAPTLVTAREGSFDGDESGGCGETTENTCGDVRFVTLVVEGADFTRLVEIGSEVFQGAPVYHTPSEVDGDRQTYTALRPLCQGEILELAALYEDSDPAERSPPLRIPCGDIQGARCPACSS